MLLPTEFSRCAFCVSLGVRLLLDICDDLGDRFLAVGDFRGRGWFRGGCRPVGTQGCGQQENFYVHLIQFKESLPKFYFNLESTKRANNYFYRGCLQNKRLEAYSKTVLRSQRLISILAIMNMSELSALGCQICQL